MNINRYIRFDGDFSFDFSALHEHNRDWIEFITAFTAFTLGDNVIVIDSQIEPIKHLKHNDKYDTYMIYKDVLTNEDIEKCDLEDNFRGFVCIVNLSSHDVYEIREVLEHARSR